jgi:outer membrane protein TolC
MPVKTLKYFLLILLMFAAYTGSLRARIIVRIGYFEGGPYFLHKAMFNEVKEYLETMKSDDIEIIYEPSGYFSAEWDRDICRAMAHDLARLKNIDLVIAAGPWVIEDLIEAGYEKPIVGIYQFDPEVMGLLDSTGKPVIPNLTVNYRPNKIKTDLDALRKLFPSREIGLLYFPSGDESRKIENKVYKFAGEHGSVVFSGDEYSRKGLYSFFLSFNRIKDKIDVLYLPPLWGLEPDQIREFFSEADYARVPTFTSEGFPVVERGATASNCTYPYRQSAKYTADNILKIIEGAEPASLPTIFDDIQALTLNLEEGNRLGIDFKRNYINNAKTVPAQPGDSIPYYTYNDAVNQAIRENASLLAKGQIYKKAIAEARRAYSMLYPKIDLNVTAAATSNEAEASVFNRLLNRELSTDVIVDQNLFSYPVIKAIHIAQKRRTIEKTNWRQAELDLKNAVTLAYLSVLKNQERVEVHTDMVDRYREFWEMAVTNYRLGFTDTTDIPLLEEQLVQAKIHLYDARSELRISRIILNVLINRPADDNLVLSGDEFSPGLMVDLARIFEEYTGTSGSQKKMERFLAEYGIANSSRMEVADLSIRMQNDRISLHKRRYWPELSVRARYSYGFEFEPEISDKKGAWTFGGILHFPILSRTGRTYSGKVLRAELDELLYAKDTIRFSRYQDIITKAERFTARVMTLPMNYFIKNLSSANMETAATKYDTGEFSVVDLSAVSENLGGRELALVEDKYQFFMAYSELLHAIGTGYLAHNSQEAQDFYRTLEEYMGN